MPLNYLTLPRSQIKINATNCEQKRENFIYFTISLLSTSPERGLLKELNHLLTKYVLAVCIPLPTMQNEAAFAARNTASAPVILGSGSRISLLSFNAVFLNF